MSETLRSVKLSFEIGQTVKVNDLPRTVARIETSDDGTFVTLKFDGTGPQGSIFIDIPCSDLYIEAEDVLENTTKG